MATRTENQSVLIQELLDEIESCLVAERWEVPLDFVLDLVEVSREEFYRYVYARREPGNWTEHMPESFDADNTEDLIAFLEHTGLTEAEEAFYAAGFYFTEDHLLGWLEFFQSVTLSRMQSHPIDGELLETAMAGCQRFADAVEFYGHCKFDEQESIRFAVRLFIENQGIANHHFSQTTLYNFLKGQFHQRNLIWEDLYRSMFGLLRDNALRLGLAAPEEIDEFAETLVDIALLDPGLASALKALEMSTDRLPDREALKKSYRALLKRFHPDVNPQGQEKTRDLIAAYSLVISHLGAAA
ncbi:MAG: hypothetical protein RIF32_17560 [Leptospirales bacterium]|jgi:hypothetical protein